MLNLFIFILICSSFTNSSSDNNLYIDYSSLIVGHWVEGRLDAKGMITKAPPSRGGSYSLDIEKVGKVSFNGSPNCGFGEKRVGRWQLDDSKKKIRFHFTELASYHYSTPNKEIDITESYDIKHLESNSLIIKNRDNEYIFYRESEK